MLAAGLVENRPLPTPEGASQGVKPPVRCVDVKPEPGRTRGTPLFVAPYTYVFHIFHIIPLAPGEGAPSTH